MFRSFVCGKPVITIVNNVFFVCEYMYLSLMFLFTMVCGYGKHLIATQLKPIVLLRVFHTQETRFTGLMFCFSTQSTAPIITNTRGF